MTSRSRVALTLLAALFLLAFPAVASAETFTVNSTGDEPDALVGTAGCLTAGLKCTLRAAIEESNNSVAEKDTILFDATVFKGRLIDTIEPSTAFQTIVSPVEINAGTCMTAATVIGPCAGISGPSGGTPLSIEADESSIFDLAITNASTGIRVDAEEFTAGGNWLGVKLDGTLGTEGTSGIAIGFKGAEATIGGTETVQRNLFAGNSTGLDIEGADNAKVLGNWFGLKPDGTSAGVGFQDIELTDYNTTNKAEGNEIGTELAKGAAESTECDGGCNVISGAGRGIDLVGSSLQGESPATGPTIIRGNFIGLNPAGTGSIVDSEWGILAGGAGRVTVGGYLPGERNYLSGGSEAISTENGESFVARGNTIGQGPGGAELTRPGVGIFALDQSVGETANIEVNTVLANGVGIEQRGATGHITGNEVFGGTIGIYGRGEPGGGLIASNLIEGASEYGVLVDGPNQELRSNEIIASGSAGIRFRNPPGIAMTGGVIGGAPEENLIEDSGGPAIEILEEALEPGSTTEITRNHGSGNGGPFIDLVGGANEGIQPPVVSTALQSSATGTALPGAIVRVFFKNSSEAGELGGFLAETEATGSGTWKVTFPTIPAGKLVTATQTNELHATSELAAPVAAASESSGGGGEGGGGGGGGGNSGGGSGGNNNGGPVTDKTPPDTKITKGPPKKTHKTTVKFKFTATEGGSSFQCKLDGKPFKPCRSPKSYKKLKPGKHVFKVRAIDRAGNVDPTPAKRKFTVLG